MMNSNSPSTEPCGAPLTTDCSDDKSLEVFGYIFLLVKYEKISNSTKFIIKFQLTNQA